MRNRPILRRDSELGGWYTDWSWATGRNRNIHRMKVILKNPQEPRVGLMKTDDAADAYSAYESTAEASSKAAQPNINDQPAATQDNSTALAFSCPT
jgi:hypothetical protein